MYTPSRQFPATLQGVISDVAKDTYVQCITLRTYNLYLRSTHDEDDVDHLRCTAHNAIVRIRFPDVLAEVHVQLDAFDETAVLFMRSVTESSVVSETKCGQR